MQELKFVEYIAKKFKAKRPVVDGIGDDAAVLEYTRDKYMLVASDMIIEGTHFTRKATPFQIGWKSIAVNVSDIAAMGGVPRYALVSLGMPPKRWNKFLKGIDAICRKFNIQVIGGDTNSATKTVISVTLIGDVEKKRIVRRSGARPGDSIFVTGVLGKGRSKHLTFMPRVKEARNLAAKFKINSMIDLSDGISMDLGRLARASGVGARVYKKNVPAASLRDAIHYGEDFELLFTSKAKNLPATRIGEIVCYEARDKNSRGNARARVQIR